MGSRIGDDGGVESGSSSTITEGWVEQEPWEERLVVLIGEFGLVKSVFPKGRTTSSSSLPLSLTAVSLRRMRSVLAALADGELG